MSFGLLNTQNQMEKQATSGLRQVADMQQKNKMADDAMEAAGQQRKMSSIGTGAAIGASFGPVGVLAGAGIGWLASEIF